MRPGTPLASRGVRGVTGHVLTCIWKLPIFSGRCTVVSVPFRVGTSSTGLHSKRCPGFGSFSRAAHEIRVLQNVAPPTSPRLEFLREKRLNLRWDRKVGNPFQSKQGNGHSCRHQEGIRGSEEVMPGTTVFLSRETGKAGNFVSRIQAVKYRSELQDGTWDFS